MASMREIAVRLTGSAFSRPRHCADRARLGALPLSRLRRCPGSIRFRVASDDGALAGKYTTSGEYNTTTRYDPRARIFMVIVDLVQELE